MYSIFESELAVQPVYNGHHGDIYANYFNLVSFVRENQLAEFYGLSIEDFAERGYSLYISTAHINFLKVLDDGEQIIVKTQIDNFSGGAFNVNFWVYSKSKKKLTADGYFVYSIKSLNSNLPDSFPDDFIAKLSV